MLYKLNCFYLMYIYFFNFLQQKVREECRVNCSCDIAYIWEVKDVVHSKTVVNCSGKGFLDFPNPQDLPKPTDTLDLRNNKVSCLFNTPTISYPLTVIKLLKENNKYA